MKKKILKWAIVPMVAAIGFVGLNSFTEEGEDTALKCKKVGESYASKYTQTLNSDCTSTCKTGGSSKCYMYSN